MISGWHEPPAGHGDNVVAIARAGRRPRTTGPQRPTGAQRPAGATGATGRLVGRQHRTDRRVRKGSAGAAYQNFADSVHAPVGLVLSHQGVDRRKGNTLVTTARIRYSRTAALAGERSAPSG